MNTATRLILFYVLLGVAFCGRAESLTLHDAVFSPDGKTIGVGTVEGLSLLNRTTRQPVYSFPVENGVRFLKWAPNSKRVLLVSWKDEEVPIYSVLDLEQSRILCSFREEVRWRYFLINGEFEVFRKESIYPISTELNHANSVSFSPEGDQLVLITTHDEVKVRNTESGSADRSFVVPDHHFASIGFTINEDEFWAGEDMFGSVPYDWDNPSFHFLILSAKTRGVIKDQTIKIIHDIFEREKVPSLPYFVVSDVSPDQKNVLAVSFGWAAGHQVFEALCLADLLEEKTTLLIAERPTSDYRPSNRAIFGEEGMVFGIESREYNVMVFVRSDRKTRIVSKEGFFPDIRQNLAQPIAPDAKEFVQIFNEKLFIVNTETMESEIVTLTGTGVENAFLHDSITKP